MLVPCANVQLSQESLLFFKEFLFERYNYKEKEKHTDKEREERRELFHL